MANIKSTALCITCMYLKCQYIIQRDSSACDSCPCNVPSILDDVTECYCTQIKEGEECTCYEPNEVVKHYKEETK